MVALNESLVACIVDLVRSSNVSVDHNSVRSPEYA